MTKAELPFRERWRRAFASGDSGLKAATRGVLQALAMHMSRDGSKCYPGTRLLAVETGYTRAIVAKHLRLAEDEGWIKIVQVAGGETWRRHAYVAVIPGTGHEVDRSSGETGHEVHRSGEATGHEVDRFGEQNGPRGAPSQERDGTLERSETGHEVHRRLEEKSVEEVEDKNAGTGIGAILNPRAKAAFEKNRALFNGSAEYVLDYLAQRVAPENQNAWITTVANWLSSDCLDASVWKHRGTGASIPPGERPRLFAAALLELSTATEGIEYRGAAGNAKNLKSKISILIQQESSHERQPRGAAGKAGGTSSKKPGTNPISGDRSRRQWPSGSGGSGG